MDWIEITVRTNTAGADMVSELLMCAGAAGTVIEDRYDATLDLSGPAKWDILDPSILSAMPDDVLVRGYIPNDVRITERMSSLRHTLSALSPARIGFDAGPLRIDVANVRDEDWAENWKKYYKPFRVGNRLVIKPIWETYEAGADDLVIEIDPGMAFGNGTHETTSMCLALLEEYITAGCTLLDVGTGSGILAMAAAKLGASYVHAIDLDPMAVRVAMENIKYNSLETVITVTVGDLLTDMAHQAEVVVANIVADAVILLSKAVRHHLRENGVFISSGIIRDREQDVREALLEAGFCIEEVRYAGEWVAIVSRA